VTGSALGRKDLGKAGAVVGIAQRDPSSYYGRIFRAGIESVGRGQIEAARSTGLTRGQALVYVVLPQATRNVLPCRSSAQLLISGTRYSP